MEKYDISWEIQTTQYEAINCPAQRDCKNMYSPFVVSNGIIMCDASITQINR